MSVITVPYLGIPAAMVKLQSPNGTLEVDANRGETVHALIAGGATVTKRPRVKRTYTLPYSALLVDDIDVLTGFHEGLQGEGPWVLVDPTIRNVLGLDVSTMALRTAAAVEWVASSGTLAASATGGPVGPLTGVLTWSSLAASATLQPGSTAATANTAKAPAYLATEAVTVSLYAKASSSTTATLRLAGYTTTGAYSASLTASMSLTTSWQRFTVTAAAGNGTLAGLAFVLPQVLLGGSVPTSVSIAAAQLEYGSAASSFQRGYGSPRVLLAAPPPRSVIQLGYTDSQLTFAEV